MGGRRLEEPVDLDPQVAPERWAEERDLARAVQRAVDALPPGQRAAVLLAYLAGLSQAETASVLGVPLSAVKARLHKARAALRARLWTLSKEEEAKVTTAAETTTDYIDVHVLDVRQTREQPGRNIVLLEEVDGGRILPIWVGPFEGDSIVLLLEKVAPMRPPTFTFAARVLQAAGGTLREVRVSQLTSDSGTFYAEAVVEGPGGARVIDCRPSDAMSLALATDAPIRVAAAVMEAAAEPAERYVEVPEGTLTAADGAQRLRELEARAREEWTKAAQERAARRRAMPEGQGPAGSPAVAP